MTPEMLEEAKAHIEDLRMLNSWSRGDLLLIDALAHIDAQAKQIGQLEADNRLQQIFLRGKSGCEREMLKFYECLKLIKERLVCDTALMDERGRGNQENNSVMLWKREWDELRKSLYKSNELISGIIAEFDEVEREAIDNAEGGA